MAQLQLVSNSWDNTRYNAIFPVVPVPGGPEFPLPARTLLLWFPRQVRNSLLRFVAVPFYVNNGNWVEDTVLPGPWGNTVTQWKFVFKIGSSISYTQFDNSMNIWMPVKSDTFDRAIDDQSNAWTLVQKNKSTNVRGMSTIGSQLTMFGRVRKNMLHVYQLEAFPDVNVPMRSYAVKDKLLNGVYEDEDILRSVSAKTYVAGQSNLRVTASSHGQRRAGVVENEFDVLTSVPMKNGMTDEYSVDDMSEHEQDYTLKYRYDLRAWYAVNFGSWDTLNPQSQVRPNYGTYQQYVVPTVFISPSSILGDKPTTGYVPPPPIPASDWWSNTPNLDFLNIRCPAPQPCVDEMKIRCYVQKKPGITWQSYGALVKFVHVFNNVLVDDDVSTTPTPTVTETTVSEQYALTTALVNDPSGGVSDTEFMANPYTVIETRVPLQWNTRWIGTLVYVWNIPNTVTVGPTPSVDCTFLLNTVEVEVARNSRSDVVVTYIDELVTSAATISFQPSYIIEQHVTSQVQQTAIGQQNLDMKKK